MQQKDWWEDDEVVGEAPAPVAAPAIPRIIEGPPKEEKPNLPAGYEMGPDGVAHRIPGLPPEKSSDPADAKLQEAERTASFLATNLAGALQTMSGAIKKNPNAAQPTLGNKLARDWLGEYANYVTGSERQTVEGAQRLAIDAALTLGTGAAYTKEQLEGYYQGYIPRVGEPEETVKQKARMFRLLLESAKLKAGNAAPKIDEALKAAGFEGTDSLEEEIEAAITLPGLSPQDRLALANHVAAQNNISIDQKEAAEAARVGRAKVRNGPGVLEQAGDSLLNVGAGIAEGITALPDYAAWSAGQLMAIPAEILGYKDAADAIRKPPQVGNAIQSIIPVPQDWNNWSARQVSRLGGGAIGMPQRATNALTETIVGKVPPMPPGGGNALSTVTNPQLADDLTQLGIKPTMAATGGPVSRMATAGAAQTLGGARPIVAGAQRMVEGGKNALASIAGKEGDVLTAEAMGETATRGALTARTTTRNAASAVYDDAARVAGDARVAPEKGLQALDRNIAELAEVPGGADGLSYLQGLRDELVTKFPNGITVAGVRGMRTQLRQKFFKDGLRGSDIERRVNSIVDEISDDLATSLQAQGKEQAANLFRQADEMWAARADLMDNIIMPIIGKKGEKSGEQVAKALESAATGNGKRLDSFLRALPKEDAGDVRATLINSIGKAKSGAQSADGDAFSYSTFLTNWSKMGQTARKALFAEGDRAAMDSLARVASRVKDASKYAGHSNTGSILLTGATGASAWTAPVSTALFVAGSYALGKVLASPGGARLVLRMTEAKTPAATRAAIKDLTGLAARNPAAANDILDLQARLTQALQSPASAAAAQEQEKVGQEIPGQR